MIHIETHAYHSPWFAGLIFGLIVDTAATSSTRLHRRVHAKQTLNLAKLLTAKLVYSAVIVCIAGPEHDLKLLLVFAYMYCKYK